jgi:hypothetical protein
MISKIRGATIGMLLVSILSLSAVLAPAAVQAATSAGSGPDNPAAVSAAAQPLAVGQRVWYGFQYAGDGSQILVDMNANPGGSASFAIWTPGDVQSWAAGNGENPVGRGTPNADFGDDLVWVGSFKQSGTYYIVVDQTGGAPASITLKLSGTGVAAPGK